MSYAMTQLPIYRKMEHIESTHVPCRGFFSQMLNVCIYLVFSDFAVTPLFMKKVNHGSSPRS